MDGRLTWTDCEEAGDYVVPNVLSPRDLVFRPDNMDETVPHTSPYSSVKQIRYLLFAYAKIAAQLISAFCFSLHIYYYFLNTKISSL